MNEQREAKQTQASETKAEWKRPEVTRFSAGLAEGGDTRAGDAGGLS